MPAALTRELTRFVEITPARDTKIKALHAAVVGGITLTLLSLAVGVQGALLGMSGAFISLSAFDRSLRSRTRVLGRLVPAYLVIVAVAALASALPLWLQCIVLAGLATASAFGYHALLSDPPGPMLMIMGAAIATYVPSLGVGIPRFLLIATSATLIGCMISLLLQVPRRRAAVQRQLDDLRTAVEELDAPIGGGATVAGQEPEPPDVVRAGRRDTAFAALFAAQASLISSTRRGRPLTPRALAVEDEIHALHRRLAQHMIDSELPWAAMDAGAFDDHYAGAPRERYLLGWATSSASPAWLAAWRTGAAVLLAGETSALLGLAHPYWAVMTAAIVLSSAQDRISTAHRAGQRVIGTGIGVGLFLVLAMLQLPAALVAAVVVTCFSLTQVLAPRQYLLASIVLTPIPLLMASLNTSTPASSLAGSRVVESALGAAAALLVLALQGRGTAIVLVRRQFRRALTAAQAVLRQMASDADPAASLTVRRNLHFEQLASSRALAMVLPDQPAAIGGWKEVAAALSELTYTTLAASRTTDPARVLDWQAMSRQLDAFIDSLPPVSAQPVDPEAVASALRQTLDAGRPRGPLS